MMFALAAMLLLDRHFARPMKRYKFGFAVCVILGICSHLTFVYVYAALFVWSLVMLRGRWSDLLRIRRTGLSSMAWIGTCRIWAIVSCPSARITRLIVNSPTQDSPDLTGIFSDVSPTALRPSGEVSHARN